MKEKVYIAIDLKSFYASQECIARGLDPLTTNLVVADASRTEKTICLAVSPSLKSYGISGRARLFEVVQKVKEINALRRERAPGRELTGSSCQDPELKANPSLALDYIAAPPRMGHYMECSTKIYNIYLKYVAPEDIHVYSIDEVFIDATPYLRTYGLTAPELARKMIEDVLSTTGITATAGIGTNLYLAVVRQEFVNLLAILFHEFKDIATRQDLLSCRGSIWVHESNQFLVTLHHYSFEYEWQAIDLILYLLWIDILSARTEQHVLATTTEEEVAILVKDT